MKDHFCEENSFNNTRVAIQCTAAAIDLILWNNTFNLFTSGILLSWSSTSPTFGRAVLMENTFALPRDSSAIGIDIHPTSGIAQYYDQVVIRKNVIEAYPSTALIAGTLSGIKAFNISNAIVENNVMSDCESAVNTPLQYQNCTTFKAFNNQNRSGTLLHAYNNVSMKYLMELEDFTEDVLLGF